jgi:hypothetical protein
VTVAAGTGPAAALVRGASAVGRRGRAAVAAIGASAGRICALAGAGTGWTVGA